MRLGEAITPIATELPQDPSQPVIFLPQGDLFMVPFAAIPDGEGKYFIERHTISTAPSIQTQHVYPSLGQTCWVPWRCANGG